MFVLNSPPQPYSQSPQPLPALQSNVLASSESYTHLHQLQHHPESPQLVYHSPLQRHIQNVFDQGSTPSPHAQRPIPLRHEYRHHETHRSGGLGFGLQDPATKADLLTRSNSNARTQRNAFQPQKRGKGTHSWQLKQFAEATLGSGSLRKVVQLPEGEDRDEWLAVNGKKRSQRSSERRGNVLIRISS